MMSVRRYVFVTLFIYKSYSEPKPCESKNAVETKHDDLKEAWDYCKKSSKSIEVLYRNDDDEKVLAKVHFRSDPSVSNMYILYSEQQ